MAMGSAKRGIGGMRLADWQYSFKIHGKREKPFPSVCSSFSFLHRNWMDRENPMLYDEQNEVDMAQGVFQRFSEPAWEMEGGGGRMETGTQNGTRG